MLRLIVLAPLLIALVTGCAPARVQLATPPPKDAPLEQRRAYFEDHRPMAVRSHAQTHLHGASGYLILDNGARVESPQDLLAVVEPTSPTARAAARAEEEEAAARAWGLTAIGVYTGGLLLMLSSLGVLLVVEPGPDGALPESAALPAFGLVGAGALVSLTALVPLMLSFGKGTRAAIERETAFLSYHRSLRERLDLTKDDVKHLAPVAVQNAEGAFELPAHEGAAAGEELRP